MTPILDLKSKAVETGTLALSLVCSFLPSSSYCYSRSSAWSDPIAAVQELNPKQDDSELLKKLEAGFVAYEDLPLDKQKEEAFLLLALQNRDSARIGLYVLEAKHLDSTTIRAAAVESAPKYLDVYSGRFENAQLNAAYSSTEYFKTILDHPIAGREFLSLVTELTAHGRINDIDQLADVISRNAPEVQKDEFLLAIRNAARQFVLSRTLHPELGGRFPNLLMNEPDTCRAYIRMLQDAGNWMRAEELQDFGLKESEVVGFYRAILKHPKCDRSQLFIQMPSNLLLSNFKAEFLAELGKASRQTIGALTDELIADPEVARTAHAAIERDPRILSALRRVMGKGLGEDHAFSVEVKQRILSSTKLMDKIIEIAANEPREMFAFSDHYLNEPYIRHGINQALNAHIADGTIKDLPVNIDLESFQKFPQLLWALIDKPKHILPECFTYNPRALVASIKADFGSTPDTGKIHLLLRLKQAGEVLGITEFGRFDNFYELARNRYLISPEPVQLKLKELLGEKYFDGVTRDTRPLCIIINPDPETDHNKAFFAREDSLLPQDQIDAFTAGYQVLYFQSFDEVITAEQIIFGLKKLGETSPLNILGGHGNTQGLSLGSGRYLFDASSGSIDTSDKSFLEILGRYMTGTIILASCSTGAEVEGESENLAKVVHAQIPHADLFAPMNDVGVQFFFNKDGSFKEVDYIGGRKIHYKSDGEVIQESSVASAIDDSLIYLKATLNNLYREPVEVLKTFLLFYFVMTIGSKLLSAAARTSKHIFSATNETNEQSTRQQLLLFPEMYDDVEHKTNKE